MKVKGPKVKGKREQGKDVSTGSLGIGDAYAYGISALIEKEAEKGSDAEEWLGKKKETLDPTKFVNRDKLNVKK